MICLPIGTVVKLRSTDAMVGSLGNLYESVENLNQNYMQPNQTKDVLLNPRAQSSSTEIAGFLTQNNVNDDEEEGIKFYMCPYKCNFVSVYELGVGTCGNSMNNEVHCIGKRKVDEKKSLQY